MDSEIRAVFAYYPAMLRPEGGVVGLGNAGGLSGSRLWQYWAGGRILLARCWPVDGPPRSALEAIHGWLKEAGALGFVPVPFETWDGRTLVEQGGRFWEVGPWMPGRAEVGGPIDLGRVRAAFAALGAFHQRLAIHRSVGRSAGLVSRAREVEWWREIGFGELERASGKGLAAPLAVLARRWVKEARGREAGILEALTRGIGMRVARQPCLRDVRPEHFLFTGESVTGLVDFGAMGMESVSGDLARLIVEWGGRHSGFRRAALDAYGAIRPLEAMEIKLIDVFERSTALLGAGHWLRWHFLEGREFEDAGAVLRRVEKGLESLIEMGE